MYSFHKEFRDLLLTFYMNNANKEFFKRKNWKQAWL